MGRVVFLLEEKSMKVLLDGLLPRIVPSLDFLCVPHEGKQDLEKSIPRKLRAWREPGVRFVGRRGETRVQQVPLFGDRGRTGGAQVAEGASLCQSLRQRR
ncbi:MAG: hypothetical protein AMXMBFR34_41950 [Myxococcaceae bacterium]